tara:strand:- start:282 stop:569 length:288 start_codon:yes stop_codon:yes gene_type:complete
LVSATTVPIDADEDTPEGCANTEENTDTVPIEAAAETPAATTSPVIDTVAVPIEAVAETPVTTTGEGLFQAPEFHVSRFQPEMATSVLAVPPIPE